MKVAAIYLDTTHIAAQISMRVSSSQSHLAKSGLHNQDCHVHSCSCISSQGAKHFNSPYLGLEQTFTLLLNAFLFSFMFRYAFIFWCIEIIQDS